MNYKGGGGGGKAGGRSKPEGGGGSSASTAAAQSASGASFGAYSAAQFDSAFSKSPGARDNFVALEDFRKNLGGTRAEQDAAIRASRIAGKFSLDSHEGLHGTLTPGQREASIHEAGSRLVYISYR